MKAPEKIYIDDFGSELSYDWHTEHSYETSIEYTRTDVFIEKACELLVDCIEDFMLSRMEIWDEESKKQTLENLRKALKK